MPNKVLIVDDSMMLLRFTANVLHTSTPAYDVATAKRGGEGVMVAHGDRPDLILLDYALPDMKGEEVCGRLLDDPLTSDVPVVLMCGGGIDGKLIQANHRNVVKCITKPFTPELLKATVSQVLRDYPMRPANAAGSNGTTPGTSGEAVVNHPPPKPAARISTINPKILFCGYTDYFPLRSALNMIECDHLSGLLRIAFQRYPIEVYVNTGKIVMATTRDVELYAEGAKAYLPPVDPEILAASMRGQSDSSCPFFALLGIRKALPEEDVVPLVREYGQRLFARLWTAGRIHFEFEPLNALPEFARHFPPHPEDIEHWELASLRFVKQDALAAFQRVEPTGIPSYTREGYERVQRLRLTETEMQFASLVNGVNTLHSIAKKLALHHDSALLILFRFRVMSIMDYWPASIIGRG